MNINLLVIRTKKPELLKNQYEKLGFVFDYHQHEKGPFHYASKQNSFVFEIYPLTKSMTKADGNIRLGFDIPNLSIVINKLKDTDWIIISDINETEWGIIAIIQDLDGRKIELKSK